MARRAKSPIKQIQYGPEARKAQLYTEFEIQGKQFSFTSPVGSRSCTVVRSSQVKSRGTLVFTLACDLTWFEGEHKELGPVRIFQDPRIENTGWIFARRDKAGKAIGPFLSYFNQHLIFHIGNNWLYYPRAWQVVSSITSWPPEYHQYHHLEDRTPVFDLITRTPNVATKGISTISILGKLTPAEDKRIRERCKAEIDEFNRLPASKMAPERLTPAQRPE